MLSNAYFIIFLQKFVLIQPRTSPPKIYNFLLIFPILLTAKLDRPREVSDAETAALQAKQAAAQAAREAQ